MAHFVATFHTHLSAMRSHRALQQAGAKAALAPVPRKLSASCGTCVRYEADGVLLSCIDVDVDSVFEQLDPKTFHKLYTNEA